MRCLLLSMLAVLLFGAAAVAGPIRDWVRDHRPGVIIPKVYRVPAQPGPVFVAPNQNQCPCGPTCPCPPSVCPGGQCPAPKTDVIRSAQPFGVVIVDNSPCPGGKCPVR